MNKSIVIVDDNNADYEEIAVVLNIAQLPFFPTGDEYERAYKNIIKEWLSSEPDVYNNKLTKYFSEMDIVPELFIVDISLTGDANDKSGIALGAHLKKTFPTAPIIFVTSFTTNQLGGSVPKDETLVYKSDLKTKLVTGIQEKINTPLLKTVNSLNAPVTISPNNIELYYDQLLLNDIERINIQKKIATHENNERTILKIQFPFLYWLDLFINWIFIALIIGSCIFLLYFAFIHVLEHSPWDNSIQLKIVEYLFLSPLPLIISFTFFTYYKKILRPTFFDNLNTENDSLKVSSMLNINISKYLFLSIIFSTLLISIIEFFNNATNTSTLKHELVSRYGDSINNYSDSALAKLIIKYKESGLMEYNKPYYVNSDFRLYGFIAAGFIIVLLVFYLFRLEKHISSKRKE